MNCNVITIGDEILIGQIVDTNSATIAQLLGEVGVRVERRLTVGDSGEEIASAVTEAMRRAPLVIITGGLGPTKDDITKTTLAALFDSRLVRHEPTYRAVEQMMRAKGIEFNELNQGQALVPECCEVLTNRNGTAPGMWFEKEGRVVVSLPGVPFEMEALMREEVIPKVKEHFALRSVVHRTMITFGLAESMLAERIAEWEDALPEWLHLAYLPSPRQLRLRLSAYDVSAEVAEAEMEHRFKALEAILGDYFVGYGEESVAGVVARMLTERGATLACAESCTGGALSSRFTAEAGASAYFVGSVVSYSNDVKVNVLGVRADDIAEHGAVSQQVAEQMAEGVRRVCGADYAIATTGIAGPDGGTPTKPVGTVWIAVATPEGVTSQLYRGGKLRSVNIERSSTAAINMLRLVLKKSSGL